MRNCWRSASASFCSRSSRRATRTSGWPCSAYWRVNSSPKPLDAPVMRTHILFGVFISFLSKEGAPVTNAVLSEKVVCVGLFDNEVCICTFRRSFLGLSFQAYFRLLVQGQCRSFEIGEDGGPTFFTESFNRGALSRLPSRREFLNLFSAFGSNRQFHKPAAPAAAHPYQTVSLQRSEISHKRRALHA